MTGEQAEQVLDWLTGYFSKRLEDNERLVWLATLAEMNSEQAMQVAVSYGQSGSRFPTVPEFRRAVRTEGNSDLYRQREPEEEQDNRVGPPPEWVQIWCWARWIRDPADTRAFPKREPYAVDAMTDEEYQQLRAEWVEVGSPRLRSSQIVKAMTGAVA